MNFLVNHTVIKFFMESLWRDEAFSWAMASQGLGIFQLTARDFNPPLYYVLLYGWMQIAGSSEAAMRSLSVLFFVGTLYVCWRFMIDLLNVPARRAVLYLALIAINPMLSYYAVEARMYSLLAMLAALSYYAYLTRRPYLYVLGTAAGLYTHYFMFLVIACQVAGSVLTGGFADLRRRLPVLAAPLLLLAPWVVMTLWLREDHGSEFWVEALSWKFAVHVVTSMYTGHDAVYGFLERPERWLFAVCLVPFVLWCLWAGYRWVERRVVVANTALWALLPPATIFVLSFVKPVFVPRYLIFSAVGLLLLFVAGLERLRPVARAAALLVLAGLAVQYQLLQADRHSKGVFRETIAEISRQAGPEDLLYVARELEFFPAEYYFDRTRVFIFGPKYEDIKAYTGKVLIPRDRVVLALPQSGRRVFVLKGDREVSVVQGRQRIPVAVGVGQH